MRPLHIFLIAMSLSTNVVCQELFDERRLLFREVALHDTATVAATLNFLADTFRYEREALVLRHGDRLLSEDQALSFYEITNEDTLLLRHIEPLDDPLMITEYVEGSSWNKAVEICNTGDMTVDLESGDYVLQVYTNGSWEAASLALTGVLAPGGCYVVAHTSSSEVLQDKADELSGVVNYNGDDVIALKKGGEEGEAIDVVGKAGEQPASGYWGEEECSTVNHTLRRNCGIEQGRQYAADTFDPAEEWSCRESDNFEGLGRHCVLTKTSSRTAEAISLYPNPCTDRLMYDQQYIQRIEIINSRGDVCLSAHDTSQGVLNIKRLSRGVYFVQLYTEKGIETHQIVKEE